MKRIDVQDIKRNAALLFAEKNTVVIEKDGEPVGIYTPLPKEGEVQVHEIPLPKKDKAKAPKRRSASSAPSKRYCSRPA